MGVHADKVVENTSKSISNSLAKNQNNRGSASKIVDNRPEAIAQRKLLEKANNRTSKRYSIQKKAKPEPDRRENNTGLPDNLKSGIEYISGYSMDDVKVHYNSNKPAQLNAHAFAKGTDIHLASGQEKHLPHEAWHVVQQKQGRVEPTIQIKPDLSINNDKHLEKEADIMGSKALFNHNQLSQRESMVSIDNSIRNNVVQKTPVDDDLNISDEKWNNTRENMDILDEKYTAYDATLRDKGNSGNEVHEKIAKRASEGVLHWTDTFNRQTTAYMNELDGAISRTGGSRTAALGRKEGVEPDLTILQEELEHKDIIEVKYTEGKTKKAVMGRIYEAAKQLIGEQNPIIRRYIIEVRATEFSVNREEWEGINTQIKNYAKTKAKEFSPVMSPIGQMLIRLYVGQSTVPIEGIGPITKKELSPEEERWAYYNLHQ